MHILVSTSGQYDPKEFRWVRFTGVRPVTFKKGRVEFELKSGSVYGFKLFRRGVFYIIDKNDLDVRFTVTADSLRKLMNRSEGYEGRVGRVKVENGKVKSKLVQDPEAKEEKVKHTATQVKPYEPKDLSVLLRKMQVPDAKTIKYIGHKRSLTDYDVEYYFDASKVAPHFGKTWETKLETQVMKMMQREVTVGCTEVMYNDRVTPVIIICE